MQSAGVVTAAQVRAARGARLAIRPYPSPVEPRHGYAKEYLRQQFRDQFGGDKPPDWEVHTTLLPGLQDAAERAVSDGLARVGVRGLQAALVALDPRTGNVLAVVGGRDFRESQFNRAVRSRRQPGSAFKPFVYAVALERGLSPVSEISGLSSLAPQGPEEWTPRNVSDRVEDRIALRQAFYESNNRAAVVLQQHVGARTILRLASDAGMPDQPNVPSLALGSGLVSPMALTTAYAIFANGGDAVRPRAILRVLDQDGDVVLAEPVQRQHVLSPEVAFQMTASCATSSAGARARRSCSGGSGCRLPARPAARTSSRTPGSSASLRTSSSACGSASTSRRRSGADAYGGKVAGPIWADFMRRAGRVVGSGTFDPPATLETDELCRVSFVKPVEGCPLYTEYFKSSDAKPRQHCQIHQGTLRQRAQRAIEKAVVGAVRSVWDKIWR